ncbi:restriction modification system DNA specificity domain [Acidithiobacillus ferrooxidans ATCC 53993]|uniref:restriction endonuclease subunit S n=2 Tax=Acidithiobacillus ferrooxidans TaxID=920 RepID=UPI00017F6D1C|nr:restriction endonuclease subunit S [Acidithiobacillus ferrooxidans]ACH82485.1 restriction modification system DNA specificity domain [Acidithiobacillus ferrooxidans ATCC 53993]
MREGWEVKLLGEVSAIGAGNPAPQDRHYFEQGTIPFIRTSDVGRIHIGEIFGAADLVNELAARKLAMLPVGTILFPKSGASTFINHRVIMGIEAVASSHLATIKAKPHTLLDKFLFYYLLTIDAKTLVADSNYPSLRISDIATISTPLPPLPEQRRIVAILDEAFEGIATAKANAEKNLQNAHEIFESYLNAVFSQRGEGWVDRRLGDVAMEFGRGKSKHRPRNDPKLYGGNFPFIQTGDVRNSSHLITSYDQTYNDAGLAQSKLWPKGTLCITIAANIAETGILDFDACFPDSIIGLVANEKISTNKYIEYLLTSFKSRLQFLGKGSAQDNINLATFESQYFPFPPLSNQKEIVSIFDDLHEETQHLKFIYQQKLAALDELKQSLLHQAFNGDL